MKWWNKEGIPINKIFVIADTHFGHDNIIKYESRPFKNSEEMDAALIENWNRVVGPDDVLYFLGDFALCAKKRIVEIGRQLKGYKIFIYGNHDRGSISFYKNVGFHEMYKKPIEIDNIILSHKRMPSYALRSDQVNIHGHSHSKCGDGPFTGMYKCVSVENIGYTPMEMKKALIRRCRHDFQRNHKGPQRIL